MTRFAYHWLKTQPILVNQNSVGGYFGTNLQTVFDASIEAPTQVPTATNRIAWVVTGQIGGCYADPSAISTGLHEDMAAEVTVAFGNTQHTTGPAGNAGRSDSFLMQLRHPPLDAVLNGNALRAHSFFFIIDKTGYNQATAPMKVVARIRSAVGPVALGQSQFWVQNINVLAFDLTTIGAGDFFFDESPVNGGSVQNGGTVMPATGIFSELWASSNSLPFTSGEEEWMFFEQHAVAPGTPNGVWTMQPTIVDISSGTVQHTSGFVGNSMRGQETLTSGTIARNPDRVMDCQGRFTAKIGVTDSDWRYRARGLTHHHVLPTPNGTPAGTESLWYASRVLGIKYDQLHASSTFDFAPAGANFYGNDSLNPLPAVQAAPELFGENIVQTDPGVSPPLFPPGDVKPYCIIADCGTQLGNGDHVQATNIYRNGVAIGGNNAASLYQYSHGNGNWTVGPQTQWGTDWCRYFKSVAGAPGQINVFTVNGFHSWAEPRDFEGNANDAQVLMFFLDDDPYLAASGGATPGAEVPLNPGTEAVSFAALNELPVTPEATMVLEDVGLQAADFRTEGGRVRRWPLFITPRYRSQFTWGNLTAAQKSTLDTFFRAQGEVAFKTTVQGETTDRAFVVSSPFTTEERSSYGGAIVYSGRIEVIELVYYGA